MAFHLIEIKKKQEVTIKNFVDTWANQRGHPLLSVENLNKSFIRVRQEKFTLYDNSVSK